MITEFTHLFAKWVSLFAEFNQSGGELTHLFAEWVHQSGELTHIFTEWVQRFIEWVHLFGELTLFWPEWTHHFAKWVYLFTELIQPGYRWVFVWVDLSKFMHEFFHYCGDWIQLFSELTANWSSLRGASWKFFVFLCLRQTSSWKNFVTRSFSKKARSYTKWIDLFCLWFTNAIFTKLGEKGLFKLNSEYWTRNFEWWGLVLRNSPFLVRYSWFN